MKLHFIFLLLVCVCASALKDVEKDIVQARGKGKYALLTNFAILLATKVGLSKIILGIAFVVSIIKAMVVMAWALAISKYVPDVWPQIHFFYVAATKIFVLKIVYGIIFFVIVTKAWHFVLWLVHYLKDKRHHEHYVEYDHDHYDHHHDYHGHHDHQDYHSHDYDHQPYGTYEKPVYGRIDQDKKIYDADGSYSIINH